MSRHPRQSPSSRDPAGPWIDCAILFVLFLAAIGVARAWLQQHAFDEVVESALREVGDQPDARLAIPMSMRRGVPKLLDRDHEPVLFDAASVSAQGLARREVTHVVAADLTLRDVFGESVVDSNPLGKLTLLTLDRDRALQSSLLPGDRIVWLESRPYRYRPVSDSTALDHESTITFEAVLDPGRYEFRFEAFARKAGEIESRVDLPGVPTRRHTLAKLAFHPFVHAFEWSGEGLRRATFRLRASVAEGGPRRAAFIHRAELRRLR